MDEKGVSVDNNNVTQSKTFELASQITDVNFASIKLGNTYDWGKLLLQLTLLEPLMWQAGQRLLAPLRIAIIPI
jgi:hypothetical protein